MHCKLTLFDTIFEKSIMGSRFVGKMHKKMIEERKKSETNLLANRSKPSSRRSSISPSTEPIKEMKESATPSPAVTPRRPSISISKAAKALNKVGDIARRMKRENSKESSSGNTSPSIIGRAHCPSYSFFGFFNSMNQINFIGTTSSRKSPAVSSTRSSPLTQRKENKKQGGKSKLCTPCKNKAGDENLCNDNTDDSKEFKHRIFFIEKTEMDEDEILNQLGREAWNKEPGSNLSGRILNWNKIFKHVKENILLSGLVKAATFAKKLAKEKKTSRTENSGKIIYSGFLRNRLSSESNMDKGRKNFKNTNKW